MACQGDAKYQKIPRMYVTNGKDKFLACQFMLHLMLPNYVPNGNIVFHGSTMEDEKIREQFIYFK